MDSNDAAEIEPVAGTKIWASYDIYVQSSNEYFSNRQVISESETRTLATHEYMPGYYKFTPAETGDYVFMVLKMEIMKYLYIHLITQR